MNKAILMGRLTKDPELKYTTASNVAVCTFSLAINRKFAKEGTQQADFINIVAWRGTAEFCAKWFKKGRQVAVVGSIQTRSWDDPEGKRHYATEVVADDVYFADSKRDGDGQGQGTSSYDGYTPPMTPPAGYGNANEGGGSNQSQTSSDGDGFYPIDDDQLPF